MSLRQRIHRLGRLKLGSGATCPCGFTSSWGGWGPVILAAAHCADDEDSCEAKEDPPHCTRCGGLVPRLTVAELRVAIAAAENGAA
jgi:hypothetical protein